MALSDASVCTSKRVSDALSNSASTGAVVTRRLSSSNADSCSAVHLNAQSFLVNSCSGAAILENPSIKRRKNYTKPKNYITYFCDVGVGQSLHDFTFLSLIETPSWLTSNPRNVVDVCRKLHFFSLQKKLCFRSLSNTCRSNARWRSSVSEYISMSSRKTTTPLSSRSTKRLFIARMNVAGAFVSPKGMTRHSKCP